MSTPRFSARVLGLLFLVALGGCQLLGPQDCLLSMEPGLVVSLVDSVTAGPVMAENEVIARDGAYADTAVALTGRFQTTASAVLAVERPGTYRVEATGEGYRPWVKEGVRVRKGECHVQTVELEALMQPLEAS